jgi:uncharacterized repeat protein (TIGR01451 family)
MKSAPLTRGLETIARKLAKLRLSRAGVLLATALALPLPAAAVPVVQEWYVPQPEAQLRTDYLVLAPNTNSTCDSVIALTVPIAGTKIVFDHWEDGYETDLSNPVQTTTQIWGDGNNANGLPPGYANDPASFSAGSVITMRNNVPLPRNAANILYDGRDRLGSTYGIVMTRAGWFTTPGPLLANSIEVRAVPDWGTSFELPIGEDIIFPTPLTSSMFEHCSAYIQAAANNTVVTIDVNGPGVAGGVTTVTLNQGESHLVNSGIKTQASITSTKPIQVIEFFGDIGANYESRGANIPPINKWSDDYYAPVGTASDGDDTYIFLHNPDDSVAITINYVTKTGTGSFSIPSETTYQFLMPQNSAARFTSVGAKPFWGIGTVGAEPTANNVHDWGYSLVPKDFLSTEIVVGWGAGSSDGTQNGSPVWVTTVGATKLYVDYNGDRLGTKTDPNGNKYDYDVDVTPMTVTRLFDPLPDKDQSGMRIYTLNGVLLTGAWGQDPATAGSAMPYLDLGNTLPNFPVPVLAKTSTRVVDAAPTGASLGIGDTLEYTLTLDNRSLFSLSAIGILDTLPTAYVSYVANSTTRDAVAVPDSDSGTAFPLDVEGLFVPILQSKASTVIKFRVTITAVGTAVNTASVVGSPGVEASNTVVIPSGGSFTSCAILLTNNSGTETNYTIGDGVYVTVNDADTNTSASTADTLTVVVQNTTTGDTELITLTETLVNNGIFRNSAALPTSTSTGLGPNDGTLNVAAGTSLSASRLDPVFGDTCSDTATVSASSGLSKQLYLDTDGSDGDTAGDLDRVDPVNTADNTTSQSAVVTPLVQSTQTFSTSGTSNWTVPAGVTQITVQTWGGGGAGGGSRDAPSGEARGGAGGGGGAYATSLLTVTPGQVLSVNVASNASGSSGATGANGSPSFVGPDSIAANAFVRAAGGTAGTANTTANSTPPGGAGGTVANSFGTTRTAGTNGGAGATGLGINSGAGGAGASPGGGAGGTALSGQGVTGNGNPGTAPGGGGGGSRTSQSGGSRTGGSGASGRVVISYEIPATSVTFTQTPSFAEAFSLTGAPSVTAYYTVTSGTMPGTPSNISAVLRKNGSTFATSTSVTASGGLLTFGFPSSPTSFVSTDVISLVISSTQAGVAFTVDFDSSTKPSKITLPTNTVIHADSVTIYDAPYPGGSVVTTPTVGQTLYVRAVVGDPFGAYDVTSATLAIDGLTTALGDIPSATMTEVASAGATKTYQYTWVTGSTQDTFTLTVTAKEGYENAITSTKATSIPLTALDLGTPSTTEFTTGNNGPHTLTYSPNETIYVRVIDFDENANPLVVETVTVVILGSGGDSETITLTETGPNTGIFTGGVPASSTVPGTSNNGTLYAILGSIPVVNYVDNDDALDTGSDTALIPNTIANVSVTKTLLTDNPILIGEEVQYRLRVTNTGNLTLNTVQVIDTYPSDKLTFVSATPSPNFSPAGTLTWTNIGSLVAGASADIIVNFTGSAAAAPATNTVNVTTTTTGGVNPSASDTEPVIITRPRVEVTKTLDASTLGPVNKGDNVIFNISVQNTGTTAITNLPLEDLYSDALFEYVSASPTPDGVGAGSLLWNDLTGAGSLAVNATLNISVTLKAKGASTTATNLAAVNYAEDENGDPVPPDEDPADVTTVAASISGFVYEDVGTPGFGGGDTALANVTVGLYRPGYGPDGIAGNGDDSDPVALTTTSATGYYEFLNLGLGDYVVQQTDLTGYRSIDDTSSEDPNPSTVGDSQDSDNVIAVTVSAFTAYNTNNFLDDELILSDYGTITGKVRNDTDADGDLADSDSGIGGVTIYLYTDPNGDGDPSDGTVLQTTTTATSGSVGSYTFIYVPYGSYVVVESDPPTYVSTRDGDTTADAGGSPADATNVGNDNRIPVNLAGEETDSGNDFLDTTLTSGLGSIGNLVWVDSDRDGIKDLDETGVDGVLVQLYVAGQTPGVDPPYMATTTSGGGLYSFTNALAGSYFVYLPASNFGPGAVLNTAPTSSPVTNTNDDGIDNDDNGIQAGGSGNVVSSPTIVLSALESDTTKDFGFAPNLISGTVRRDIVPDSTLNGTEPGIAGVVVELRDGNGDLIATTTTDSNGKYQFDGIPSGNYRVVMLTPVGGTAVDDADDNIGGNGFARVDVTMFAADITTRDFLVQTTALKKIAGTLYDDKDLDGVFDTPPTDTYRAGSTVQLYRDLNGDGIADPGELIGSDISDVNGYYEFADLPAGAYLVKVVRSNRCFFVNERGGTSPELGAIDDGMMVVNLAAADDTNNDFLLCRGIFLGAIGDYVWVDEDSDGNQDAGEPGLANVTVRLYAADGTTLLAETVTDTEGKYLFPNRINGDYVVKVDSTTMPAGLAANPTYDLNGINTAHESTVTMEFGQFRRDVDFGYNWATTAAVTGGTGTGAIGNRIWIDSDGDGVRDLTEAGLGGVPVAIYYDSNGDGVVDALYTAAVDENGSTGTGTTTTNEDGSYIFDNLPAGIYEIVVNGGAPPSGGYTQTGDPDSTKDNRTTTPIILAPGDVYLNADFGYQPAAASDLSGVVYFDYNANSNQDGLDAGVAGVSVALLDASGNVIATSVTDANGVYSFTDLPAGNYTVWINDTARNLGGRRQTEDQDVVIDSRHTVTLNGTTNVAGIDFGYTPSEQGLTTGIIGDTVFLDRDGDGSFDVGEGMRGVTVYLYAADGITRLDETETDTNGNYYFGGRAAGTYVVEVVTSTLPGTALQLTNTVDPDTVSPGNSRSTVTITSGQIRLDQDFGYRDLTNPNIIEGTLWNDLDADGTVDGGEAGRFADVIMVLLDANGDEVGRTTTDSAGYYAFTGLPDGTFTVDVVDRDNVVNGYWHPHGTVGVDGQSQADPYTVAVSGGNTYPADFGYYLNSPGLGNWVWNDIDADGIQEGGETGLPGVLVRLTITWPNTTTTVVTTVTNGLGYYSFANLLLDENYDGIGDSEPTFSISIPTLPGTASPTVPSIPETDSNTPTGTPATVVMGATDNSYDFGFYNLDAGTATLRGIVYDDGGFGVVGNGSFTGGTPDATVPNVLVKLYYDLNDDGIAQPGEYVAETRTDGSGAYSFATLPNGPYLVIETDPSGASSVTDTDGITNGANLIEVTLSGGVDSSNNNFLDDGTPTTSLSGFVYDDAGFGVVGNGDFGGSPADAPIGGVVVKIYADANIDGIAQTNELVQTTSTDGTGYYIFSNLPAGNYLVVEIDPSGATSITDSDGNGNGNSKIAATVAGTPVTNQNFLDDAIAENYVYSISGTVYDDGGLDTVGNGLFGGAVTDSGISGVTVLLYADVNDNGTVDSGDVLVDTEITSGDGLYTFTNVPNGNYLVVETDPDAFASLTDIGEPDNNNDDNTIDVTITNASQTGKNFLDAAEACPDTWLEWQDKWDGIVIGGDVSFSGNPDGDRYNNLNEYAYCLPPNSGVGKPFCLEPSLMVSGGIDGVFRRTAGGPAGVVYTLERTAALGNATDWTTLTPITLNSGNTTVTINADGTETVRIVDLETKTSLTGGEGFVRMRATINGNSATTEVLGWTETSLNQTCSTFNNPFLRCAKFTGEVAGVSGQTVTFTGSGNLGTLLAGGGYYLEVTSGPHAGHRFDVDSASGTSVTLTQDANIDDLTAPFNTLQGALPPDFLTVAVVTPRTPGDTVVIRPHWTLGEQFPATDFAANADPKLSDQVQICADGTWTAYYVFDDPTDGKIWKNLSGHALSGSTVLPPGQGMFVSKPQFDATVLMYGEVRENDFIRPLRAYGTIAPFHTNLVGGGFPINQSANAEDPAPFANDREMSLTGPFNRFFGSRDFKTADSFFIWRGDPPTLTEDGYDTYYLFSSVSPRPVALQWVMVGDVTLEAQDAKPLFLSDRSVFIRVKNALPAYKMPCPWTP